MLVSHSKKFIFLKTMKTAGASVEIYLERYCVPLDAYGGPGAELCRFEIEAFGYTLHGAAAGPRHPVRLGEQRI